jgi:phenylacetate-coenzyme A ligase PaaK-like adenylate-forming protein
VAAPWDRRSEDEQRRIVDARLATWIQNVTAFSPYWATRLERAQIDPGRVGSLDRLADIPTTREVDLLDAGGWGGPALVMRPTENDLKAGASFSTLMRLAASVVRSGPTGKRRTILTDYKPIHLHRDGRLGTFAVAYARRDLDTLHRAGARAVQILGLSDEDYLVSAVPAAPTLGFWGLYHAALGSSMLAIHARTTDGSFDGVIDALRQVPATVVAVPAGEELDLARAVSRSDANRSRISTVLIIGPPPDPDRRDEIVDAWRAAGAVSDVRVLALWAPPGGRALWAECAMTRAPEDSGLHTFPDLDIVEVTSPAGRQVRGAGDLTYTSLGWHGTAMLRFQTGDHVSGVQASPCPSCGRTVPRIVGPVTPGAWERSLDIDEGPTRIDLRGVARVLTRARDVVVWRAEVRGRTKTLPEGYVAQVAGDVSSQRLVELEGMLTAAVGREPRDVVHEEASKIESRIQEVGGVFEDRR